jgi:hypothetical protein
MFSQRLWIAAALAASCTLAPLARAQGTGGTGGTTPSGAGGLRVTLISIGKEEVDTVGVIYLNRQQCRDNDELLFKVDYVPQDKPSLDIYTGENCNSENNRGNSTNLACTFLTNVPTGGVTMGLMLHIPTRELLNDESCDAADESMPKLWFLAVSQKMSVENVHNNYGRFDRVKVDTALPTPPINVRGGEGENTIPVSWQGGQTNLKGFRIYIDPNAGLPGSGGAGTSSSGSDTETDADAAVIDAGEGVIPTSSVDGGVQISGPNPDCPSSVLMGGGDPADLPASIRKKTIDEPTGTGTELSPSQIGGTHAAIAVVAIDLAGNESAISEVECIDVVETTGFWDRYEENGGEVPTGCPCSAVGAAQIESAWPVGLAVLALGISARRRRSS